MPDDQLAKPASDDEMKRANFIALKSKGHSVSLDETVEADGRLTSVRVTHYLTCVQCQKDRRGKHPNPFTDR